LLDDVEAMNAYQLDACSADIAACFSAHAGPDPWQGGQISVGQFAPVVVLSGRTGAKVMRPMHWGYPAPGKSPEMTAVGQMRWVSSVRNLDSPFWVGNLRHRELRCLVPMTEFPLPGGRSKALQTCRLTSAKCFAVAGIWRDLTDMPVFAILTTEPSAAFYPIEGGKAPASVPAILATADWSRWLTGDWPDVRNLIRPYRAVDLAVD